jgi:Pyridoxamine 5'-phosphate oxidase
MGDSHIGHQRRGRRLAMSQTELDGFLQHERTCRVATINADGSPHVSPLWYVWDRSSIWLYSLQRSRRWYNLLRRPDLSVVVDVGILYRDLRGVELSGQAVVVGEVPRVGLPVSDLYEPERLFVLKYAEGGSFRYDGRHAWVRLDANKVVSWDFRKIETRSLPESLGPSTS